MEGSALGREARSGSKLELLAGKEAERREELAEIEARAFWDGTAAREIK